LGPDKPFAARKQTGTDEMRPYKSATAEEPRRPNHLERKESIE